MTGTTCFRHPFELSTNVCCSCGHDFCGDCLVYPRGGSKPPLCVSCAVAAAGVRSTARLNRSGTKRDVKRRVRARRESGYVPPDVYAASRDPFGLKLAGWAGTVTPTDETAAPPAAVPAAGSALPTVFQGGAPRPERGTDPSDAGPELGFDVSTVLSPPVAPSPVGPAVVDHALAASEHAGDVAPAMGSGVAPAVASMAGTTPVPVVDDSAPAAGPPLTDATWFGDAPEVAPLTVGPEPAPIAPGPSPVGVGFADEIVPIFDEAPPWAVADLDLGPAGADPDDDPVPEPVSVPRLRVAAPLRRTDDAESAVPSSVEPTVAAGPSSVDPPVAPEPPKPRRRPTLAPLPGAPPALPFASATRAWRDDQPSTDG